MTNCMYLIKFYTQLIQECNLTLLQRIELHSMELFGGTFEV